MRAHPCKTPGLGCVGACVFGDRFSSRRSRAQAEAMRGVGSSLHRRAKSAWRRVSLKVQGEATPPCGASRRNRVSCFCCLKLPANKGRRQQRVLEARACPRPRARSRSSRFVCGMGRMVSGACDLKFVCVAAVDWTWRGSMIPWGESQRTRPTLGVFFVQLFADPQALFFSAFSQGWSRVKKQLLLDML